MAVWGTTVPATYCAWSRKRACRNKLKDEILHCRCGRVTVLSDLVLELCQLFSHRFFHDRRLRQESIGSHVFGHAEQKTLL